jgi:Family of unknown function (DUF6535)
MSFSSCAPRFYFPYASLIKSILQMSLFSAVVAALLSLTVPDLKQDTSAFYLKNIYQLQVLSGSNTSLPSTPAQPPPFSAPTYAIWVNALLFMSLSLNIFIALMALWIQRRVSRYLSDTESPQFDLHYRARMREILATEFYNLQATFPLIAMLWLSTLLFFTGLSLYLFNINRVVFGAILGCICLCFIAFFFILHWLDTVSASHRVLFSFCQA